jgi:hypothetical protein
MTRLYRWSYSSFQPFNLIKKFWLSPFLSYTWLNKSARYLFLISTIQSYQGILVISLELMCMLLYVSWTNIRSKLLMNNFTHLTNCHYPPPPSKKGGQTALLLSFGRSICLCLAVSVHFLCTAYTYWNDIWYTDLS